MKSRVACFSRSGTFRGILLAPFLLLQVFAQNPENPDDPTPPGEPPGGEPTPCTDCEGNPISGTSCSFNASLIFGIPVGQNPTYYPPFFTADNSGSGSGGPPPHGVSGRAKAPQGGPPAKPGLATLDNLIKDFASRKPLDYVPAMLEAEQPGEELPMFQLKGFAPPPPGQGYPQESYTAQFRSIFSNPGDGTVSTGYRVWAVGDNPDLDPAINEVIFTKTSPIRMVVVRRERFGVSGEFVICEERLVDGETLTINRYLGPDTSGPLIRREVIEHLERGARLWDYKADKKIYEAELSVAGPSAAHPTIGELRLVNHTIEQYGDFSITTNMVSGPGGEGTSSGGTVSFGTPLGSGLPGGRRTLLTIEDPDGVRKTTRFTYAGSELGIGAYAPADYGTPLTASYPDGSWSVTTTSRSNSLEQSSGAAVTFTSWKDLPVDQAESGLRTEDSGIKTSSSAQALKTVSLGGVRISKEEGEAAGGVTSIGTCSAILTTHVGDQAFVERHRNEGAPREIAHPDGTVTIYEYGVVPAPMPNTDGQYVIESTGRKGPGENDGIISGTRVKKTYNRWLQLEAEERHDIASGLLLSSKVADLSAGLDNLKRPVRFIHDGNPDDYTIERHNCCGLEFIRNRDGSTTEFFRDGLKRVWKRVDKASPAADPVTTIITYNGLVTTTRRFDAAGTATGYEESFRNLAGEEVLHASPDEDGDGYPEYTSTATMYPEAGASGGKNIYTAHPDGSYQIEARYRDGRIKSVTGTAVPDVYYDYGVHSENGGGKWTKVIQGSPEGTEWTKTYADSLGREFKVEYPDGAVLTRTYYSPDAPAGSRGKLATVTDPDGVTTGYTYDGEGEIATVTEAMPGGQQRVTTLDSDVVTDPALGTAYRSRKWINGVLVSTEFVSADGRATRTESLGTTTSWEQTLPVDGAWTTTSTTADGATLVRTYSEGRLARSEFFDNQNQSVSWTSWTYDAFGRVLTETDSRTGTTTRGAYTDSGNLLSSTDPGGRTTAWGYDIMGRTVLIDQPDTSDAGGNPMANITFTSYHPTGEISAVWGSQTNPTYRVYDEQNRLTQLRTWRSLGYFSQPQAIAGGYDATNWTYHPQRGWLTAKRDAAGKGADYTYSPGGRLATRQWARTVVGGDRLTTSYGYDAGKLVSTTYNDGVTTDVTYAYDAFGRQTQVTQAGNSWTYGYDPATLLLKSETVTYDTDLDGTGDFTRVLDRSHDARLRPTGYQLKDGPTVEAAAAYSYDASGRLLTVGDGTDTFTYGYGPAGHLVKTVTGPVHTVTNVWDTTRDALLSKENKVGGIVISGYEYTVNAIGQRSAMERSSDVSTGSSVAWSYNDRGEVVSAAHSDTAKSRYYEYDLIGNRRKVRTGSSVDSGGGLAEYNGTALNQYFSYTRQDSFGTLPIHVNPAYDADGNQLLGELPSVSGSFGIYSWDAENRLTGVTSNNVAIGGYRYDPFGRRIMKTAGTGGPVSTFFLYDGWNLIGEYSASGTLSRSHLWGSDLSGSMQGAGGVGGLLSTSISNHPSSIEKFYPAYDGNGNVGEYLDAGGSVAARFEYDPFGRLTANSDFTKRFPIRFSTKWQDFETGLNYYGYRYYDPQQGRWLSRDPIHEGGFLLVKSFLSNLMPRQYGFTSFEPYSFSLNNGVTLFDSNGEIIPLIIVAFIAGTGWALAPENEEQANDPKYHEPPPEAKIAQAALAARLLKKPKSPPYPFDPFMDPTEDPLPPGHDEDWEYRCPEKGPAEPRWFDPDGGEWRYHPEDDWHNPHWDHNPWDSWNSPWENVPIPPLPPLK